MIYIDSDMSKSTNMVVYFDWKTVIYISYLLTLPLFAGVSRMDWVSCAGDINLPHTPFPPARYPPNKVQ